MPIKMQERKIPSFPGVYFFKNRGGKILYVGKASNLKARLRYYLDAGRLSRRPASIKAESLLKEATKLEWQILNSETEALIKESELIKKYQPKYNVLMRDDKQYFFVRLTKEEYPKVFLTHQPQEPRDKGPGSSFIGPFTDGAVIKSVLKLLRRIFPYCICKKTHKNLCLNARIGRCLGFCCNSTPQPPPLTVRGGGKEVELSIYNKNIKYIKSVLTGKNKSLIKTLKKEMKKLSAEQNYEEAGKIRDQIKALEKIFAHKEVLHRDIISENIKAILSLESLLKIKNIHRIEAYDIANIQGKHAYGSMVVFSAQDGPVSGWIAPRKNLYRIFSAKGGSSSGGKIKTVFGSNDIAMLKEVITRRLEHKEWRYPDVILVDGGKQQLNAVLDPISLLARHSLGEGGPLAPKIIALTKNKKHIGDHIYISDQKEPFPLNSLPSPLKNLLLHLNSEAHRFAIKHYRQSHRKNIINRGSKKTYPQYA